MTVAKNDIGLGVIGLLAWGAIIALAIFIMLQMSSVKDDIQNPTEPQIDIKVVSATADDETNKSRCIDICVNNGLAAARVPACCVGSKDYNLNRNYGCIESVQENDTCYCSTSEEFCKLPFAGL